MYEIAIYIIIKVAYELFTTPFLLSNTLANIYKAPYFLSELDIYFLKMFLTRVYN